MPKLTIHTIGKAKEPWLIAALEEYEKRLPFQIEWKLYKDNKTLENAALKLKSYHALDPTGQLFKSEGLAKWFEKSSPRDLLIGGAEGLSNTLKSKALSLISLSPLTFTHQMTRLILLEQLYRATQINAGTNYHK